MKVVHKTFLNSVSIVSGNSGVSFYFIQVYQIPSDLILKIYKIFAEENFKWCIVKTSLTMLLIVCNYNFLLYYFLKPKVRR